MSLFLVWRGEFLASSRVACTTGNAEISRLLALLIASYVSKLWTRLVPEDPLAEASLVAVATYPSRSRRPALVEPPTAVMDAKSVNLASWRLLLV